MYIIVPQARSAYRHVRSRSGCGGVLDPVSHDLAGVSRFSYLPLPCGLYARRADPIVRPSSATPLAHAYRALRWRDDDIPEHFVDNYPRKACSEGN